MVFKLETIHNKSSVQLPTARHCSMSHGLLFCTHSVFSFWHLINGQEQLYDENKSNPHRIMHFVMQGYDLAQT